MTSLTSLDLASTAPGTIVEITTPDVTYWICRLTISDFTQQPGQCAGIAMHASNGRPLFRPPHASTIDRVISLGAPLYVYPNSYRGPLSTGCIRNIRIEPAPAAPLTIEPLVDIGGFDITKCRAGDVITTAGVFGELAHITLTNWLSASAGVVRGVFAQTSHGLGATTPPKDCQASRLIRRGITLVRSADQHNPEGLLLRNVSIIGVNKIPHQ